MTLTNHLSILRRSWLMIVATTLVGALVAPGLSLTKTPIYQAQSQLFVSVKSAGAASEAYSGDPFVQQRVKSYVDVADSYAVLNRVIDDVQLQTTSMALADRVSAATPPNSVLLTVSAQDESRIRAAAIADAVAASYAREIAQLEGSC